MSIELTAGEFLAGLLPRLRRNKAFPAWPPDCFAVCLSLLRRTGAYSQLFMKWPPGKKTARLSGWTKMTQRLGRQWRIAWKKGKPFTGLENEWSTVCASFVQPLYSVGDDRRLCEA